MLARILNTVVTPAQAGVQSIESLDSGLRRNDETLRIFNAWSDEEWVNEGAAVRVSLVCFGFHPHPNPPPQRGGDQAPSPLQGEGWDGGVTLNGEAVQVIHADLTAGGGLDLTQAKPLKENAGVSFQGSQKIGAFDIEGDLARQWLKLPNPHGRPNSEVLKPSWNGLDVARRPRDGWIIDFGTTMNEADAALYEVPFEYVAQHVKPEREKNNREAYRGPVGI